MIPVEGHPDFENLKPLDSMDRGERLLVLRRLVSKSRRFTEYTVSTYDLIPVSSLGFNLRKVSVLDHGGRRQVTIYESTLSVRLDLFDHPSITSTPGRPGKVLCVPLKSPVEEVGFEIKPGGESKEEFRRSVSQLHLRFLPAEQAELRQAAEILASLLDDSKEVRPCEVESEKPGSPTEMLGHRLRFDGES